MWRLVYPSWQTSKMWKMQEPILEDKLEALPPEGYGWLYLIRAPSGKGYVGKTKTRVAKRYRRHARSNRAHECPYIWRAIQKYGASSMKVSILGCCRLQDIDALEAVAIRYYRTLIPSGYNLAEGGLGGRVVGTRSRNKMGSYWRGRKRPVEFGQMVSKYWSGRKRPPRAIPPALGYKWTPEQRAAHSIRMRARKWKPSKEHQRQMLQARWNKSNEAFVKVMEET